MEFIILKEKILNVSKKDLMEQAILLNKLPLWKILKKDVQYQLRKKMFEEATVELDLVWGKLTTFLWDIINTRIDNLRKGK